MPPDINIEEAIAWPKPTEAVKTCFDSPIKRDVTEKAEKIGRNYTTTPPAPKFPMRCGMLRVRGSSGPEGYERKTSSISASTNTMSIRPHVLSPRDRLLATAVYPDPHRRAGRPSRRGKTPSTINSPSGTPH